MGVISNITATLKKHIENGTTPEFGNLTEMIESLYTQNITKWLSDYRNELVMYASYNLI